MGDVDELEERLNDTLLRVEVITLEEDNKLDDRLVVEIILRIVEVTTFEDKLERGNLLLEIEDLLDEIGLLLETKLVAVE